MADLNLSTSELGWFDVSLLLPYAVSQMTLGSLSDRLGAQTTLAVCLTLSGFSMVNSNELSSSCLLQPDRIVVLDLVWSLEQRLCLVPATHTQRFGAGKYMPYISITPQLPAAPSTRPHCIDRLCAGQAVQRSWRPGLQTSTKTPCLVCMERVRLLEV